MKHIETRSVFLAGGGNTFQSKDIDDAWIKASRRHFIESDAKTVAYVPQALSPRRISSAHGWFATEYAPKLESCGLKVTFIGDLKQLADTPSNLMAAVYIGGGDTNRLIDAINSAKLAPRLHDFLDKGVAIYGGSAGAIIMGDSTCTAPEVKKSTPGLFLISPDTLVACHYDSLQISRVHELQAKSNLTGKKIVAIPEESGLRYDANSRRYFVYGTKPVTIFNKESEPAMVFPGGKFL